MAETGLDVYRIEATEQDMYWYMRNQSLGFASDTLKLNYKYSDGTIKKYLPESLLNTSETGIHGPTGAMGSQGLTGMLSYDEGSFTGLLNGISGINGDVYVTVDYIKLENDIVYMTIPAATGESSGLYASVLFMTGIPASLRPPSSNNGLRIPCPGLSAFVNAGSQLNAQNDIVAEFDTPFQRLNFFIVSGWSTYSEKGINRPICLVYKKY
jgi:hypothetical protein